MPTNIFINYRRQTDSGIAGRIYDSLSLALPDTSIFMDVDKLNPGDDFEQKLDESLASCEVLLAVIGPTWTTMVDEAGQLRLDNPDDFVRRELRSALAKSLRVIPVLVDGAGMPNAAALPPDLAELSKRQAMDLRHERFKADVDALAQAIAPSPPATRSLPWRTAAFAVTIAIAIAVGAAGGLFFLRGPYEHRAEPRSPAGQPAQQSQGPADQPAKQAEEPVWTAWMDRVTYGREFDRRAKNEWYPSQVEAQLQDGVVMYRALFEPFPTNNFQFGSINGMNDEELAQFDGAMSTAGYKRVFHQRIVVNKRPFNQATWIKP